MLKQIKDRLLTEYKAEATARKGIISVSVNLSSIFLYFFPTAPMD